MTEKRALGKGLSALIPPREILFADNERQERVLFLDINGIKTNKYQPRTQFDEEKLNELVKSIKEKGVIQPVLVRKALDGYELIAGERRLRAAKRLNIDKVPAIVKDVSDIDMLEIALIENIQREELNPIEEASAYKKFVTEFGYSQDKIAEVLGKDKSTVSNTLRLLTLPEKIRAYISKNSITAGHAKALLSLPTENEQYRVCSIIINKGLSVREAERLAARRGAPQKRKAAKAEPGLADVATELEHALGTRVRIFHGKKRGTIQIEYYSVDDLNRIIDLIIKPEPAS
jgi:ParB family chromosome partitioning protein